MHTTPMTLVTIVGEAVLLDRLRATVLALGASGWTATPAEGAGSRGVRASPRPGENVRLEVVVTAENADRILETLAHDYFPHYALVAWVAEVHVVRGEKYG